MSLPEEILRKALALGVPLSAQLDVTWRCNERCVHCYLDHEGAGEMSLAEVQSALRQLAECGAFYLAISGGEPLYRRDCFEILEYARAQNFSIKLKTNAVMIHAEEARRIRQIGVEQVQVSVYSHRPEVHDTITKLPGSLKRTVEGIRQLKAAGMKVSITNVLMQQNVTDNAGVRALAKELGAEFVIDPTITPMLNGDTSIVKLGLTQSALGELFRDQDVVGDVAEFCAPPATLDEDVLDGYSCSAGHTAVYISPTGDVFPCVQFPMKCGSLREQSFAEIWRNSPELVELRSIKVRDLPTCSSCSHVPYCSRCPGLAYMEGDMRGASSADCKKSKARTGSCGTSPLVQLTL